MTMLELFLRHPYSPGDVNFLHYSVSEMSVRLGCRPHVGEQSFDTFLNLTLSLFNGSQIKEHESGFVKN